MRKEDKGVITVSYTHLLSGNAGLSVHNSLNGSGARVKCICFFSNNKPNIANDSIRTNIINPNYFIVVIVLVVI